MSTQKAASVCYIMKDAVFAAGDKLIGRVGIQQTHQALIDAMLAGWFGAHGGDALLWTDGLTAPMLARHDGDGYALTSYTGDTSGFDGPCFAACGTDGAASDCSLFGACVGIAYMDRRRLQAAVVYDPVHVELFHAVSGLGAYLNGKRITPSSAKWLSDAHVSLGQAALRRGGVGRALIMEAGHIHAGTACALELCHAACGRTDAAVLRNEAFVDYAAGLLVAQEAGTVLMNGSGEPLGELREYGERRDIAAVCPGVAGELARLLSDK